MAVYICKNTLHRRALSTVKKPPLKRQKKTLASRETAVNHWNSLDPFRLKLGNLASKTWNTSWCNLMAATVNGQNILLQLIWSYIFLEQTGIQKNSYKLSKLCLCDFCTWNFQVHFMRLSVQRGLQPVENELNGGPVSRVTTPATHSTPFRLAGAPPC